MNFDDMIDAGTDDMIGPGDPGYRLAELQFHVYGNRTGSDSQQEWLTKLLAYHHDNDLTREQKQALWEVMKDVYGRLVTLYREEPAARERALAMMTAITEEFELRVTVKGETRYMSDWLPILTGAYDQPAGSADLPGLIAHLMEVPHSSAYQETALDDLLAYRDRPTTTDADRTTIDQALLDLLNRDGERYMREPKNYRGSFAVLDRLCTALPGSVVVKLFREEAPISVYQGRIRALHVLLETVFTDIESPEHRRAVGLLLGAYWCGVEFPAGFHNREFETAARIALHKVLYTHQHNAHGVPEIPEFIRWVEPEWDPEDLFYVQFDVFGL